MARPGDPGASPPAPPARGGRPRRPRRMEPRGRPPRPRPAPPERWRVAETGGAWRATRPDRSARARAGGVRNPRLGLASKRVEDGLEIGRHGPGELERLPRHRMGEAGRLGG